MYRRLLQAELDRGVSNIFSHNLASLAGSTAAQVRRDLTYIGCTGSPKTGYPVSELRDAIGRCLSPNGEERLALVGVGDLGRAILSRFRGRQGHLSITAAFDTDISKTGRVTHGCRCYSMSEIEDVVRREGIVAAILAVPADEAQGAAETLAMAGVTGILNFAPVSLRLPRNVHVENNDLTMAIEKVAFFGRENHNAKRKQ